MEQSAQSPPEIACYVLLFTAFKLGFCLYGEENGGAHEIMVLLHRYQCVIHMGLQEDNSI